MSLETLWGFQGTWQHKPSQPDPGVTQRIPPPHVYHHKGTLYGFRHAQQCHRSLQRFVISLITLYLMITNEFI